MKFLFAWFAKASPVGLLLLAVVVGVGGAVGAAIFHFLIAFTLDLFYGDVSGGFVGVVEAMPVWQRLLIPTAGGLLVGCVFWLTRVTEAEGEGVPEVIEALAVRHGNIRPVVAPVKILAAALTLGSGGSAGREGPVIQIGSAIGSSVGQWCGLAEKERSLLLAAGAAAAIGGAFGAPLAGVIFTLEILKHRPSLLRVSVILLAALIGDYGARLLIPGHEGLRFLVGVPLTGADVWPVLLSAILVGVLAAGTALLFGQTLKLVRAAFLRLPVSHFIKPAIGGFIIGVIGLFVPYVHEPAAYPLMIDLMALTTLPVGFLLILFVIKMVATGITLGSGGVGGIFAPSLLLGTILGSIVGVTLVTLGLLAPAMLPLMVVIGVAAVFAGAAHAPFTAVLITLEMTEANSLVVPLVVATVVAVLVAKYVHKESIYHQHT